MTSTLASMRRLSVRFGPTTVDLAVPLGTLVGDLLGSGGFPAGSRLVDASGAPLPDDERVGDTVEDGAILYVVDVAHAPSLTRVTAAGPGRGPAVGTPTRGPGRKPDPTPAPGSPTSAAPAPLAAPPPVLVDPASAGSRTRSTGRRTARGRTAGPVTGAPGTGAPAPTADPTAPPTGRRAVVPPTVRRGTTAADVADVATGAGPLPAPPGSVPAPPGRTAGRGAHVARHGAPAGRPAATAAGSDLATTRRGVAVPPPPRVDPPPGAASGRAAARRATPVEDEQPAAPRGGPASVALSPGTFAVPMALAATTVVLVLLVTLTGDLPTWSSWSAGAALLLSGIVAVLRPDARSRARWGRIAGALAGGCGGFVLAVSLEAALDIAAVCGLAAATAVAMLGRVAAIRQGVFEPWITVAAVGCGGLAADAALAIALSWPAYVGPLLLAGVAPLVMRALPALSLDVPEEQLIDTERLSNTSWSARTGVRRRRRPLRQATVELITLRASGIVAAGTVAVALLATFGYGIAVLSAMPGSLARWALLAEGVLLAVGLGLATRTMRDRFGKRMLRFAAAVLTVETGYYLAQRLGTTGDVVLVVLLVVAALGAMGVSVALDSGWRSLRLSRIADAVEGFCVVFALPAALLAADVIAVLRQAAS